MGHTVQERDVRRAAATDAEAGGEADPRAKEVTVAARGVLFVHSCPPALRPHVEWAVAGVLGVPVRLDWEAQPVSPDCLRAQSGWRGPAGTAGRIAAALRNWPLIRCEVTEEPSAGCDGTYPARARWYMRPSRPPTAICPMFNLLSTPLRSRPS